MLFKNLLFFLVVITQLNCYGQTKLSRLEKKILKQVSLNQENAIIFLEKVVNINSGTLNKKGVRMVGDVFRNAFDDINFSTQWMEMPEEMNRAGHLFAYKKGSKGKKLLLIGHLDTVFEENSPFQTFERRDSIAYAPGGNDMKGGNVVMLYALKALDDLNLLNKSTITVALTGDEESTGKPLSISRKDLIEAAKNSDIALGFENSTGYNNATIARRGSSGWSVTTTGVRAHSSGIFRDSIGAGAIFEMGRILHKFYEEVRGEELLTFNPGNLMGGTFVNYDENKAEGVIFGKTNVIPQIAKVNGGLRFISEEQKERARNKMRLIVQESLPYTTATISFTDSYPAMQPSEGNSKLLKLLSDVSLSLKQGEVFPYDPGKRGAADVSFVADYVDALDGLGTMGSGAHTPNETVNLKTMEALISRTAIFIHRLVNIKN
ncbi:MAG: M20/M25/M40 family metallo-hydrolase [Flavobacteriaceae bacterium]|nr:M20/M25/M40 family metallo-hydrolase [Flavobacteriaceae bacterium]MBT6447169.1 M20/M25/M40 family metallo-hydrolase [Flavobacteriaceae bacterium]MDG1830239.1 M20/M25/M40 family metallo-hydrolase [Flavobacteriaceae bacterium]